MKMYVIHYRNKDKQRKIVRYRKCNNNNNSLIGKIIQFESYFNAFEFTKCLENCSEIQIIPIKLKEKIDVSINKISHGDWVNGEWVNDINGIYGEDA